MKRSPRREEKSARALPTLEWPGKSARRPAIAPAALTLVEEHAAIGPAAPAWKNLLIQADNRRAITALLARFAGQVDLVYLDPPFATGGSFSMQGAGEAGEIEAYSDRWEEGLGDYLSTMQEQLDEHTGLSRKVIIESKDADTRPRITIKDEHGKTKKIPGASQEALGGVQGTGLRRLRERLTALYGDDAVLQLDRQGRGVRAMLTVPSGDDA